MQVHLKKPVEVTVKGDIVESEFLNIPDPSRSNLEDLAIMQQIASKTFTELANMANTVNQNQSKSDKDEEEEKMTADDAISFLKMAGVYKNAIEAFDVFLIKHASFDDTKVKKATLDRIDLDDYINALGEYFAGFCF
jgi:hypothetical protein